MTGIVASVTGIIILYINIYEGDEDYYSYPIQAVEAVDQGNTLSEIFIKENYN